MIKNQNCTRREFCKSTVQSGLAAGLLGLSTVSCSSKQTSCDKKQRSCGEKQSQPNIVLILTDDQGINDVGLFGSEIATPNIDSIGKNGIKFTNFYVSMPVCTPSRYSLLTGRYPYRAAEPFWGVLMPNNPVHNKACLEKDEITIADILKNTGYKTALIGKWHLGHGDVEFGPNNHGFDEFYGLLRGGVDYYKHTYETNPDFYRNKKLVQEDGYITDLFTDEALRFINKNKNCPFFLYLAYSAPHYARCPDGVFLQTPPGYPNLPEKARNDRRIYSAMVENMDKNIGKVLDELKKLNLEENTIVIFLSDNGGDCNLGGNNNPYKGQKGNFWEGGIKTPCVMQWKANIPPGQVREQICITMDMLPTLTRWTGAKLPDRKLDGINLNDIILNNCSAPQRHLYFRQKSGKHIAVRLEKWKYIREKDGSEYLFDMKADPCEQNNTIAGNQNIANKLKEAYEKFTGSL